MALYAIAQRTNSSCQYAKDDLAIASFLVAPGVVTHYIPFMNVSDATWTLHGGTQLGDVFPGYVA